MINDGHGAEQGSFTVMRANSNLRPDVYCSTLGAAWIQSCCLQIWTCISALSVTRLVEAWPGEDSVESTKVSLNTLLLHSGGFIKEEINWMEKKAKKKKDTKQEKGEGMSLRIGW